MPLSRPLRVRRFRNYPLLVIGLLVLLVLLVPACSEDDVPDASIRGRVTDADGQPVAGAAILLCYDLPQAKNGAKPQTAISFNVATPGPVQVYVTEPCHDTLVRSLVDGDLVAGVHMVTWDGKDEQGRKVVAGFYALHLVTTEQHDVRDFFMNEIGYAGQTATADLEAFAVTDADGRFSFGQDCLAFGREVTMVDETGQALAPYTIPHRATLWAVHDVLGAAAGPALATISPTEGADITIVFSGTSALAELRAFAAAHWSVEQLDCALDPGCAVQALAGLAQIYFAITGDHEDLPLWVDPSVDEAAYLNNLGRWSQFVFGWDDFLAPADFVADGEDPTDVQWLGDPRCSAHREAYRLLLAGKTSPSASVTP